MVPYLELVANLLSYLLSLSLSPVGGTLVESDHSNILYDQLKPCAPKWDDIAKGLRFKADEIAKIEADPKKMRNAPESWLGAVIDSWVHWVPGDTRGSKDYPKLERLKKAVDRAGYGDIAAKLNLEDDDDF